MTMFAYNNGNSCFILSELFPLDHLRCNFVSALYLESRKENPQKLTQLSSRSHPRHLVGKRTAQKDTIIDITSDSQVNSNSPYRWSPASLTFNNYFYLFLYLYITSITINNNDTLWNIVIYTLWNIVMILHSYVEQVMTMCHLQE